MLLFDNSRHPNPKIVAGFNTGHHGGFSIIANGKAVAVSEERLNRRKYSEGYADSFFYCLEALDISATDIDLFVSSSYHAPLPGGYAGQLGRLGIPKERFVTVDHHLSHAYAAYGLSPFEEALVIVIDGLGNGNDTESYYLAKGATITKVGGNDPDRSMYKGIGRAYESFTNFCGWSAQEAGKTMGLAGYGTEKYPNVELFRIDEEARVESLLEGKYYHGAQDFAASRGLDFGPPFSQAANKDAAFFVQERLERIVVELVRKLQKRYGITNLCLAGGVFLNGLVNKRILEETPIQNIYVPPCCDDTGQPLGNALFGYASHFGNPLDFELTHAYLGAEYAENHLLDVLEKKQSLYPLPYEVKSREILFRKMASVEEETARLLADGKIIGWLQGASEIGPRALGHRSILCAPSPASMKDTLNEKVKHREPFRPFAPVVLEERCSEYFDLDRPSPFMLLVAQGREEKAAEIAAVLHVDGTARVQTIRKADDARYYGLIEAFGKITGTPVLLDTSFNDSGEPIVETPKDALTTFCKTPLDYLIMDDYLVWKS